MGHPGLRGRGRPRHTIPALSEAAYGDGEFEIRDPNGYVLVFGE